MLNKNFLAITDYIASKLHCNKSGCCQYFAEWFAYKCPLQYTIVEGWVKSPYGYKMEHTWIEVGKEKIDPTFIQFLPHGNVQYTKSIKNRYTRQEYLDLCIKNPDDTKQYHNYVIGDDSPWHISNK